MATNVSSCINFTETGEWRADIIITELRSNSYYVSVIGLLLKVEIFLEQRERLRSYHPAKFAKI
jgi:hypothetical protein